MAKNYVIGITGGSGSGKTEFLNRILESFNEENVCLLSQDNYYWPRQKQQFDENGYINFDLPETIDVESFEKHLSELKNGNPIEYEEYVFGNPPENARKVQLIPAPVIMVEGIFAFHFPAISDLIDLKLFIDADTELMLKRRLLRDQHERGYSEEEIIYRFENHVIPACEKYILPYKKTADMVIPNNNRFDEALKVVAAFISEKIKHR